MTEYNYFDLNGAAHHIGVARQTVYIWIKKGVIINGARLYLPVRLIDGVYLVNADDLHRYVDKLDARHHEAGYDAAAENKQTTGRPITKEKQVGLNGEETLEYIDGVMKEYGLRPSQKIDTLIQKIEEFEDGLDEADDEDESDEDESDEEDDQGDGE